MKFLTQVLVSIFLFTTINTVKASSLEDHIIQLDCPNLMKGTLHINNTWDNGYLEVKGVGTLALKSFEQIDNEGAFYIFSNGEIRAKILPWVKNNVIRFYLWDSDDWKPCDWK